MNKEEILSVAKTEKRRGSEFESEQITRANLLGMVVALIVGLAMFLTEIFCKKSFNFGLLGVLMTAVGWQAMFEGIKLKKKWMIIIGVIEIMVAAISIFMFIGQMVFV